jgi:hypothetical protein
MDKQPARGFFKRYRDSILFNRNLIIAGAGGFSASAYMSQLYSQYGRNDAANSVIALATEYSVYIPVFALLFYIDNRSMSTSRLARGTQRG